MIWLSGTSEVCYDFQLNSGMHFCTELGLWNSTPITYVILMLQVTNFTDSMHSRTQTQNPDLWKCSHNHLNFELNESFTPLGMFMDLGSEPATFNTTQLCGTFGILPCVLVYDRRLYYPSHACSCTLLHNGRFTLATSKYHLFFHPEVGMTIVTDIERIVKLLTCHMVSS